MRAWEWASLAVLASGLAVLIFELVRFVFAVDPGSGL